MSDSEKNNTKSIPVLKRKHVRTMEVPILEVNTDASSKLDSPDFHLAVSKAVSESINKAIPSIVEEVLQELELKTK